MIRTTDNLCTGDCQCYRLCIPWYLSHQRPTCRAGVCYACVDLELIICIPGPAFSRSCSFQSCIFSPAFSGPESNKLTRWTFEWYRHPYLLMKLMWFICRHFHLLYNSILKHLSVNWNSVNWNPWMDPKPLNGSAPLIRYTILALYKFICMYVCMNGRLCKLICWEPVHSSYIHNNRVGRLYCFSFPARYCEHCHKREVLYLNLGKVGLLTVWIYVHIALFMLI